ncbi:MAG: hypothetical protein A2Y62_06450 [Candidatus Fischerbacteria bacterium RBG_13_37_8]|uniref:Uncharacterized protein n=1 Tax=Candidatus Fischerbacteria bacterium RBG_13_37_8 TaxID=1817863 RepID=A0A1F5VQU1_9BACT|nr:MAG: hypothetical protein A2Y62_06450 [Candidatus Fischerbacteria bacterium RBG_13_37_8]
MNDQEKKETVSDPLDFVVKNLLTSLVAQSEILKDASTTNEISDVDVANKAAQTCEIIVRLIPVIKELKDKVYHEPILIPRLYNPFPRSKGRVCP